MNRAVVALILLCGLTFFAGIGRQAITDSDEAYYAEAGREMIQSGDWLTPHYNFTYRLQKPVLLYWLIASTYLVAGVHEAAARFWAAAAGLGLTLLTFNAGLRWYNERTGTIAAAITATSFGYFALARLALPDLPVAFFITLATYSAFVAIFEPAPRAAWWSSVAGAAAGLGCLTKGPIAIVLPVLVLTVACVLARRRLWERPGDLLLMLGAFTVVAAPWYAAMVARHGLTYLQGFLVGDNIERFATSRFNEPRSLFFYIPVVLGGMLPWTPFALLTATRTTAGGARISRDSLEARLVLWALVPLLFLSVSVGKQPRYILPILPPLAILIGHALAGRITQAENTRQIEPATRFCAVLSGLVFVFLGLVVRRAEPLIAAAAGADHVGLAATIIALSGLATILAALRARLQGVVTAVVLSATLTLVTMTYGVLGAGGSEPVEQMAAMVATHRQAEEPIGAFRVMVRNLVFYTGVEQVDLFDEERAAAFLQTNQPVLCVMTADDRARLANARGLSLRTLGSLPYANLATLKVLPLLTGDPASAVQVVELVSNR